MKFSKSKKYFLGSLLTIAGLSALVIVPSVLLTKQTSSLEQVNYEAKNLILNANSSTQNKPTSNNNKKNNNVSNFDWWIWVLIGFGGCLVVIFIVMLIIICVKSNQKPQLLNENIDSNEEN